ncbi:PPOX class F420-dependent oxidoreductase [Hoyosella altamirensis]|uniref:PPOX class probable F420-dependent enzyme n=1 Tax=Hoyosella altamirensis TaxID=616997 RepID=A0A839RLS2_9ACTN|nr:PPOX class F420-dependent oxidoreductase [Hoyosella altamirensis]MBB3037148.1 PPOX class probable F420-dependent enzyme [Hoyosella altamirensis]
MAVATAKEVSREELLGFLRTRHRSVLITHKHAGGLQVSPVTSGIDDEGRVVISTYPERAKTVNIKREPLVTLCVLSDEFNGPYVQIDGSAEVLDIPDAVEPLVEYYRCIAGEHPDWDEYRAAMRKQRKSLIRVTITSWGPIATGGFPPGRET